jgi:hypothetical protein
MRHSSTDNKYFSSIRSTICACNDTPLCSSQLYTSPFLPLQVHPPKILQTHPTVQIKTKEQSKVRIISVTSVALANFHTTCDEGFPCSTLIPTTRIPYPPATSCHTTCNKASHAPPQHQYTTTRYPSSHTSIHHSKMKEPLQGHCTGRRMLTFPTPSKCKACLLPLAFDECMGPISSPACYSLAGFYKHACFIQSASLPF